MSYIAEETFAKRIVRTAIEAGWAKPGSVFRSDEEGNVIGGCALGALYIVREDEKAPELLIPDKIGDAMENAWSPGRYWNIVKRWAGIRGKEA